MNYFIIHQSINEEEVQCNKIITIYLNLCHNLLISMIMQDIILLEYMYRTELYLLVLSLRSFR